MKKDGQGARQTEMGKEKKIAMGYRAKREDLKNRDKEQDRMRQRKEKIAIGDRTERERFEMRGREQDKERQSKKIDLQCAKQSTSVSFAVHPAWRRTRPCCSIVPWTPLRSALGARSHLKAAGLST